MSAATPGDSPYKGLMPYSEQDAPFFFGREPEQEIISANLVAARLTLLYGASGVGKSSVLRAGVAYHLREESLQNLAERGSPEFIVVTFNSWRDDPIDSLMKRVADSVARVLKDKPLEPVPSSRSLAQTLQAWTERFGGDLLVILDQFEEYFLYHAQEDGEGTFAVEFPRAINRPDLRATFLISIREDALAKLDRFKGRIPNLFDNYLRIEHLSPDAARIAIEKPIEAYNHLHPEAPPITIEPKLIDTVLEEVKAGKVVLGETGSGVVASAAADARIETPFLQLVMTRLWNEEKRNGSRVLRLSTLQDLGGAERIVRTHLDAVMSDFPPREQDIAARVFRYLVTRSGTKIAHTTTDLAEYAQVSEDELKPVLEKLSAPEIRVLRPVAPPPDQPQVPRYEIFHDVLAPAILDWRARFVKAQEQAEAEMVVTRQQVEAQRQLQLSFARRRASELQLGMFGLLVLLVAILALTIFAFLQWDSASRSAANALTQRDVAVAAQATADQAANARATAVADANQARISAEQARAEVMSYVVAADAVAQLQNDKQLSLLLAIEAAKFSPGADAEEALRRALLDPEIATLAGHTGGVNDAAFSPDGKTVATGGVDRIVRLWETSTGKLLRVWNSGFVYKLAFSPNGKWLVTTGSDLESIAHVLDASTGRLVADLKGHEGSISRAAFSPDSNWIVTASQDGTARVWETSTGKQLIVLRGHVGSVRRAEFSPDGRFIVTAGGDLYASGGEVTARGGDGTARVWDAKTGQQLAKLVGHTGPVIDVTFSPDGKSVLTGSADGSTRIWEVDPDKLTGPTPRVITSTFSTTILTGTVSTGVVTSTVWNTVFSPDGNYIAAAYGRPSNQARVWNAKTGKLVAVMSGHTDFVFFVAFSPDGKWIATASRDGTARVWSALASNELVELRRHTDWVNVAPFSPDGTLVLTASDDGTARLWQLVSPLALRGHTREVLRALFNSDGRLVATASADNTARVWEASTGKTVAELRGHTSFVRSAVFSPNDKLVVTASDDRTARVWDATTGMTVAVLSGHKAPVTSAAFSPDSKLVVTASADGTARVWDAGSGITVTVMNGHTAMVNSAAFSANGKLVVTASADGTARVWDASSGNSVSVIRGHKDNVVSAAFSPDPDGKYVLTASWDRTAIIWDATTGISVTALIGHAGPVHSAAFSRDGRFVVTSSADRTARVWETSTGKLIAELRGHTDAVTSAVSSADGTLVATASLDRTARVWEANTGKQIAVLRENTGAVNSVAFSPDGQSVVTASIDAAHIEPISIQALIQLADSRLTRSLTCEERYTYLRENIVCPTPTPTLTPTRAPTWTPTPPRTPILIVTPVLLRTPIPVPLATPTP